MRASRAKRRWLAWCRYVAATQTQASPGRHWGTGIHTGQARAYQGVMYARRAAPRGVRTPFYPRWATPR